MIGRPRVRERADGSFEMNVAFAARLVFEMGADERAEMTAKGRAETWPKIAAFQTFVRAQMEARAAAGLDASVNATIAVVIDLPALEAELRREPDVGVRTAKILEAIFNAPTTYRVDPNVTALADVVAAGVA